MQFLFDGWISIGRVIVSGVCSYFLLVALLRISGKRTLSKMNAFDFVVTIALGSTLATMLVSKDVSVTAGFAALATLVGMQYVVTWLSVRSPAVRRLSRSEPTLLARRGEFLEGAMRAERVNREELLAAVRKHGLASFDAADAVILETDGTFSVLQSVHGETSAVEEIHGY